MKVQNSISNLTSKNVSCMVRFAKIKEFANYLITLSNTDASIVKETHEATDQTPALTDYRYIGANPNNYVCLESSGSCTEDNLYRIIGVIPTQTTATGSYENRVKLIKATTYTSAKWHAGSDAMSIWSQSTINKTVLNKTYWNSISSYQQYIGDAKWYLGRINASVDTSETSYTKERSNTESKYISFIGKIGLINVSDFGFSTSGGTTTRKTCLQLKLNADWKTQVNCPNNAWLTNGKLYWTIAGNAQASKNAIRISQKGYLSNRITNAESNSVFPVFYLLANVRYSSGTGTTSNPYRIIL